MAPALGDAGADCAAAGVTVQTATSRSNAKTNNGVFMRLVFPQRDVHVELNRPEPVLAAGLQLLVEEEDGPGDDADVVVEVDVETGAAASERVLPGLHISEDIDLGDALDPGFDIRREPSHDAACPDVLAVAVEKQVLLHPVIKAAC